MWFGELGRTWHVGLKVGLVVFLLAVTGVILWRWISLLQTLHAPKRRRTYKGNYLLEAAREIDEHLKSTLDDASVPTYVFGHTHSPEVFPLEPDGQGARYINSGTWTPILPSTTELLATREVLTFVWISQGRAELRVWNDTALRHELFRSQDLVTTPHHDATEEIDRLIKRYKGGNVGVVLKPEIILDTVAGRTELVKDIVALANTMRSGRRWLLVGFEESGMSYRPPGFNPTRLVQWRSLMFSRLTQEGIQSVLDEFTDPAIRIRFEIVRYGSGTQVGIVEVFCDRANLPYTAAPPLGDPGPNENQTERGQVFIRDRGVTREATQAEKDCLIAAARRSERNVAQATS